MYLYVCIRVFTQTSHMCTCTDACIYIHDASTHVHLHIYSVGVPTLHSYTATHTNTEQSLLFGFHYSHRCTRMYMYIGVCTNMYLCVYDTHRDSYIIHLVQGCLYIDTHRHRHRPTQPLENNRKSLEKAFSPQLCVCVCVYIYIYIYIYIYMDCKCMHTKHMYEHMDILMYMHLGQNMASCALLTQPSCVSLKNRNIHT